MKSKLVAIIAACAGLAVCQPFSVRGQNLVQNGSFENLTAPFVNDGSEYMSLYAGSTEIADWTVTAATINEIVLAQSPTADVFSAANGTYFIDLTGFGSDSPNGGIQQTLQHLTSGDTYHFSMDANHPMSVTVGTATVSLTGGTAFTVGSTSWTPETGTFTADGSGPLLTISNPAGGDIAFIDNICITGPVSAVPEPATIVSGVLLLLPFGSGALRMLRKNRAV